MTIILSLTINLLSSAIKARLRVYRNLLV